MPQIIVNHQDDFLTYEDSGAPEGVADYTTLIIVHGSGFTGAIFRRLIPLAARNGLRVVSINRRDYGGSSPLSDAGLEVMHGSDREGHLQWVRDRGVELLKFIETYIDENRIPKMADDGKRGGVALLGWSTGNIYVISALAHPQELQPGVQEKLGQYMRLIFFYDVPCFAIGCPVPLPLISLDAEGEEEQFAFFTEQVTGYYNHTLGGERKLENITMELDEAKPPTIARMSEEEKSDTTSLAAFFRTERMWYTVPAHELVDNFVKGILEDNVWPSIRVVSLWAEHTYWVCVHANWELERQLEERVMAGVKTRPIKIEMISGTNHCMQWDDPEGFMKSITTNL